MRQLLFAGLLIWILPGIFAQQKAVTSQYILNQYSVNPAFAGSTDDIPVAIGYRQNWAGMDDAPSFQYLSGHMEIANKMGAGLKMFNMSEGLISRTGLELTYAYHITLNESGQKLAFGLSGLVSQYRMDRESINMEFAEPGLDGIENAIVPDATFGTYYYSDNYYIGFVANQLFQTKIKYIKNSEAPSQQARYYSLYGGYRHDISPELSIEPSAMLYLVEATTQLQAEVGLLTKYKDMVWTGLSYRSQSNIIFLLGVEYESLVIAYSFDMTFAAVREASYGSHEIMLMYRIGGSK